MTDDVKHFPMFPDLGPAFSGSRPDEVPGRLHGHVFHLQGADRRSADLSKPESTNMLEIGPISGEETQLVFYGGGRNQSIWQAYRGLTPESACALSDRAVHFELTEGRKQDPHLVASRVACE